MIFEDVHWIDPTSLEALGRAVDRVRTLGALLIVTYRTEFEPPWIGRPHVTALTINRLGRRDVANMIDRVVGNKFLPAEIRQDIIERTDGVPLFVEEMTKTVLEAESEGDGARCRGSVSGASSPSKPKHGKSSTLLNVEPTLWKLFVRAHVTKASVTQSNVISASHYRVRQCQPRAIDPRGQSLYDRCCSLIPGLGVKLHDDAYQAPPKCAQQRTSSQSFLRPLTSPARRAPNCRRTPQIRLSRAGQRTASLEAVRPLGRTP